MAPSSTLMLDRLTLLLDDDEIPSTIPESQGIKTTKSTKTTAALESVITKVAAVDLNKNVPDTHTTTTQGQDLTSKTTSSLSQHSHRSNSITSENSSGVLVSPVSTEDLSSSMRSPEKGPYVGQLASATESFCPIMAMSKFPYKFVHDRGLSERIGDAFFTDGRFWRMDWDVYYIWASNSSATKPLLLIRANEAERFLQQINEQIEDACLSLSDTAEFEPGLHLTFAYEHPRLRPRHLGHSFSQEQFSDMSRNCHGESYRPSRETPARLETKPDEKDLAECKLKVELGLDLCRARAASKAARQQVRLNKQQNWRQDLRQVERFLGLRPEAYQDDDPEGRDMTWDEYKAIEAKKLALKNPPAINVNYPPPYRFESEVVFISIDIECYERDKRKVTEIGVSTLDTGDLTNLPPGEHGEGWFSKIRSRHFRIREHVHLNNREFVHGCADDFRFGDSEFVRLDDAPKALATCFRPPYSAPQGQSEPFRDDKRTIVLVGHDFANDLRYMQRLGYDVTNLSTLHHRNPIADTQGLYRALNQQWEAVKLGAILDENDIAPFSLHNAGNDAAYTMQAMLAIAIKSAGERGSKLAEKRRKAANKLRIAEQARLAIQRALEEAEGWSSPDEREAECCAGMAG